jgi:hypothetical protein
MNRFLGWCVPILVAVGLLIGLPKRGSGLVSIENAARTNGQSLSSESSMPREEVGSLRVSLPNPTVALGSPSSRRDLNQAAEGIREVGMIGRDFFKGWAAMMSISDLVLQDNTLSDEELIQQVGEKTGYDREKVIKLVKNYPASALGLEDHYEMVLENKELRPVQELYQSFGIAFNPHSDCLMDGFRYSAGVTQIKESVAYWKNSLEMLKDRLPDADAQAINRSLDELAEEEAAAFKIAHEGFYQRLVDRHQIPPQQALLLLNELSNLFTYSVGPAQLNVPRLRGAR